MPSDSLLPCKGGLPLSFRSQRNVYGSAIERIGIAGNETVILQLCNYLADGTGTNAQQLRKLSLGDGTGLAQGNQHALLAALALIELVQHMADVSQRKHQV